MNDKMTVLMRVLDYNHYTYTSVYIVKFMYVGERNEDLRASMDVCVCVYLDVLMMNAILIRFLTNAHKNYFITNFVIKHSFTF